MSGKASGCQHGKDYHQKGLNSTALGRIEAFTYHVYWRLGIWCLVVLGMKSMATTHVRQALNYIPSLKALNN